MDGGEGTGSGSLLAGTSISGLLSEDSSLGDEDDVSVGELLLQLTGQTEIGEIEIDRKIRNKSINELGEFKEDRRNRKVVSNRFQE